MSAQLAAWDSFHFFYHGDRDLAVRLWLGPTVAELWRRRWIETFFFIRYSLGGPHLRLRIRPASTAPDGAIDALVTDRAAAFFAAHPCGDVKTHEEIEAVNRGLVNDDPEGVDAVYPNGSLHRLPFHPEIERYGGPSHLEATYDCFTTSSVGALEFVEAYSMTAKTRRLSYELRCLVYQALGSSVDGSMLADILAFPVRLWGEKQPRLIDRGDATFESRNRVFTALVWRELDDWRRAKSSEVPGARWLGPMARALGRRLWCDPEVDWLRVATSHLHMTANRLGLSNAEELYLCRILWRAVAALDADDPAVLSSLECDGPLSANELSVAEWRARSLASLSPPGENRP